jgi:hypothetical protein
MDEVDIALLDEGRNFAGDSENRNRVAKPWTRSRDVAGDSFGLEFAAKRPVPEKENLGFPPAPIVMNDEELGELFGSGALRARADV